MSMSLGVHDASAIHAIIAPSHRHCSLLVARAGHLALKRKPARILCGTSIAYRYVALCSCCNANDCGKC